VIAGGAISDRYSISAGGYLHESRKIAEFALYHMFEMRMPLLAGTVCLAADSLQKQPKWLGRHAPRSLLIPCRCRFEA
jgi:hypothetical protein